jgi:O-antigen biosynthesis protein WbqV
LDSRTERRAAQVPAVSSADDEDVIERALLGREAVPADHDQLAQTVAGRTVLVTGAGGSIGSRLASLLARLSPARLVLLDSSELNLFEIDRACAQRFPDTPRTAALCDVRDRAALERWFAATRPDLVFHAAALKHVPLLEQHVEEAVLTNVLGSLNVAELAKAYGAKAAVLLSTDKAVNPSSVMGATKRCAELIFQAFWAPGDEAETRFVGVRFGNVLGSTGSVVPLFREQIERGGPVTVTHPEMTRFFMTIGEAVHLIVQAAVFILHEDRTEGGVLVLDMGAPIRIVDLAERLIGLMGRRPHEDVALAFTGLRPGERLHEELALEHEELGPLAVSKILLAKPQHLSLSETLARTEAMAAAARAGRRDEVLALISEMAPEYQPAAAPGLA